MIDQFEMRLAGAVDDLTSEVRRWVIFFGALQAVLLVVGVVIA